MGGDLDVQVVLALVDLGHLALEQLMRALAQPRRLLLGDQRLAHLLGLLVAIIVQVLLWGWRAR